MLIPDHIRWVLFDAVGTLLYPDPPACEVYAEAGRRFGSALSADEIAGAFRAAVKRHTAGGGPTSEPREKARWRLIVAETLGDVPLERSAALYEQLWLHFGRPENWRVYDDVEPAISALVARGFEIGIASNFDRRLIEIVAGHAALATCGHVFVSSEVGDSKPSLSFFRSIERRLGATPDEIALVGDDDVNDVQGALAAGWLAIRLDRDGRSAGRGTVATLRELA